MDKRIEWKLPGLALKVHQVLLSSPTTCAPHGDVLPLLPALSHTAPTRPQGSARVHALTQPKALTLC